MGFLLQRVIYIYMYVYTHNIGVYIYIQFLVSGYGDIKMRYREEI